MNTVRRDLFPLSFSLVLINGIIALISAGGSLFGTLEGFERFDIWPFFVLSALAATFVSGLVATLCRRWSRIPAFATQRAGAVFTGCAGALCYLAMLVAPAEPARWFAAAAGTACGVAYPCQLFLWAQAFARIPLKNTIAGIAFSAFAAGVFSLLAFSFSNGVVMAAVFVGSLLAGTFATAWHATKRIGDAHDEGTEAAPAAPTRRNGTWHIYIGAALCLFTLMMMWTGTHYVEAYPLSATITRMSFIGFSVCASALGVIALIFPDEMRLAKTLSALAPLFAALPIVPCIVGGTPTPAIAVVFGLLTGIGFSFFVIMPLVSLCRTAGAADRALGTLGTACMGVSLAACTGLALATLLSENGLTMTLTLALFLIYLVVYAVSIRFDHEGDTSQSMGHDETPETAAPIQEEVAADIDPIDARCAELAELWGLTPRECEVLPLLAHGRTQPNIAKELFLSTETVKVHVRHIYEKAGVHSRDELIDLAQK